MNESILVAIITAGLSLIGTIITVLAANRQTVSALDKKSELSDAKLERYQAVTDTKVANHRIRDLEQINK